MFVFHLILPYMVCLAVADSISAINNANNDIVPPDTEINERFFNNLSDSLNHSVLHDNRTVFNVSWNIFLRALIKESTRVLKNIRQNIKLNYFLDHNLIRITDELFSDVGEHESILLSNLKMIVERDEYNETKEFMLDFMDMSIFLIDKMVEFNLDKVHLITPTKWYKTLKDKIQRQEIKAAAGYIENKICKIGVCKEMKIYSDYLKNWLRYLLNLKGMALKGFLRAIPGSLEKHKHFVKSNIKFRQTIKTILALDAAAQKVILDFVDEVLIARENVFSTIPDGAKKTAALLMKLFKLIDANYDVNEENITALKLITDMFYKLMEEESVDIPLLLDLIINNMMLNLKIWPLKVQNKIYFIWSQVIKL